MKMRFPDLLIGHTHTYEAELKAREDNHKGIIFQAKATLDMNRHELRAIKAEMKRWRKTKHEDEIS